MLYFRIFILSFPFNFNLINIKFKFFYSRTQFLFSCFNFTFIILLKYLDCHFRTICNVQINIIFQNIVTHINRSPFFLPIIIACKWHFFISIREFYWYRLKLSIWMRHFQHCPWEGIFLIPPKCILINFTGCARSVVYNNSARWLFIIFNIYTASLLC